MRFGYGKLGRVIEQDPAKWGESGGDNEPVTLLETLAQRNPQHEFVVVGRNSGWVPRLPNVVNPWTTWGPEIKARRQKTFTSADEVALLDHITGPEFDKLDGIICWLGQHGTSNSPIPKVGNRGEVTSPQISFVHYSSFLLRGINRWRDGNPTQREEVWLLPDARNYIKGRDLKYPRMHPILYQFDWARDEWNERYGDTRTPESLDFHGVETHDGMWRHTDVYRGSNLELVGVPEAPFERKPWDDRTGFGVLINEARNYGMRPELTRLHAMQNYVLPLSPDWVYGTWTTDSQVLMGREIRPIAYDDIWELLNSTIATFTTPSSGSGIATAKPWECFRTGTICFFHPAYDTQGWIIPTLEQARGRNDERAQLARWLRIETPHQLKVRVEKVCYDEDAYLWLREAQLNLLHDAQAEKRCVTMIEKRLGI